MECYDWSKYMNLPWVWGADRKIRPRSLFGITRLCWVMPNNDPKWRIFLSAPNNHDRFFFLHTFRSPAFDFNVGLTINQSHSYTLTSAIVKVLVVCDIAMTSTTNVLTTRVTWPPIQPMCCYLIFICPTGRIRVCKIKVFQHWWKLRQPLSSMQENTLFILQRQSILGFV